MKALITGVTGFVGQHLANNLIENGYEVWGGTRNSLPSLHLDMNYIYMDWSDMDSIISIIEELRPDVVFHLSGQSSVKYSWSNVSETFRSNTMDSIVLLEAIRNSLFAQEISIITIGSSEEYGLNASLPIVEDQIPKPMNPYGASKLAVANLAMMYNRAYGMKIIHARPFNHIGPGQKLGFVTSDFAKQIADIEAGEVNPVIYVGDLSSKRDFTDVRDIVEAYRLLYEKGKYGEIYNVCSGKSVSMQYILEILASYSSKEIRISVDPSKLRPSDNPDYFGSNQKIQKIWEPRTKLEESLADIYHYWSHSRNELI